MTAVAQRTRGPASQHGAGSATRERRRPEESLLHQIIAEHLEAFLAQSEDSPPGLPAFVRREFRQYLGCGLLQFGFCRVYCHACRRDDVVAFSCKRRGFCPSCGGRRMADEAAHLVDRVLPRVPVRHWVLSVPMRLRYLIAFDPELCRRVRNLFVRAVTGSIKRRALREGVRDPRTGAVTSTQRFGSALDLNVHFHSLVLDGVYYSDRFGRLRFRQLPEPTAEELARIVARVRSRVLTLLRRHGLSAEDHNLSVDPLATDSATLAACVAASLERRVALGPKAGQRLERVRDRDRTHPFAFPQDGCVESQGFSLHAGMRVAARKREQLENLCRYITRPPVSEQRLSRTPDGRIAYELKTPYHDGTTHFLFDPTTFLERLAATVPPPRAHLVVYHGVLAPNAEVREDVVPGSRQDDDDDRQGAVRPRNYKWAELMKRVFAIDVLRCPCGATRALIAAITDPSAIQAILEAMHLTSAPSTLHAARSPPDHGPSPSSSSAAHEPRFIPEPE